MKTKNHFLILFFLIPAISSYSQGFYNSALQLAGSDGEFYSYAFMNDDYYDDFAPSKMRRELQIKEITLTSTYKKGKTYTTVMKYNSYGKLIHSKSKNYERKSEYMHDSLEVYRSTNHKGKIKETKKAFENGKIVLEERYKNSKLKSKKENTYTSFGKPLSSKSNWKGKITEMKYTYNAEQKLIKAEFSRKGKVKRIWNYDCKPEGQLLASVKHEEVSSRCEYREESADGSYVVFTRMIIKGDPILNKKTYAKDSSMLKNESFEKDSIITYSWINTESGYTISYFHKGKVQRSWKTTYNESRQMTEQAFSKKGKLKSRSVYQYDAKGNRTVEESFHKTKTIPSGKTSKEFNENGTVRSQQGFHKGKLESNRTYTYVF